MLVAVIILGVINALLLFVVLRRSNAPADHGSALLIKQDLTTLTDSVNQLKDGLHKQISDRLDKSGAQMQRQFETSAGIIKDVTQKLTELEKTNQQVGNIASELKVLQNVLSNP
ncbi:hypothetical protein HY218_02735, partial [Candidatus Saccharibacteria bacterium]|nr:hypothetical protein [Candidatus Saccharibacteria bacterium]